MKSCLLPTTLLLAALNSACDRQAPVEVNTSTESASVASARADEGNIRAEIETGLEQLFNSRIIPLGTVEILSQVGGQMERADWAQKKFDSQFLVYLEDLKAKGLATLAEKKQSELEAVVSAGSRFFHVEATDFARLHLDPNCKIPEQVACLIGKCQILEIIRNTPYQSRNLPATEEFRLVLGTYHVESIPWSKDLFPEYGEKDYKFRAILKFNPFTKNYSFVTADCGEISKDEWSGNNIN